MSGDRALLEAFAEWYREHYTIATNEIDAFLAARQPQDAPPEIRFCSDCGSQIYGAPKYAMLDDDRVFCTACGLKRDRP